MVDIGAIVRAEVRNLNCILIEDAGSRASVERAVDRCDDFWLFEMFLGSNDFRLRLEV